MRVSSFASSSAVSERMSRPSSASAAMAFTDVPPVTVPTVNVVLGSVGVRTSPIFAIARPIAWIALVVPNASKLCPPGPVKRTS